MSTRTAFDGLQQVCNVGDDYFLSPSLKKRKGGLDLWTHASLRELTFR